MQISINGQSFSLDNEALKNTIARVESGKVVVLDVSSQESKSNLILNLCDSRRTLTLEEFEDLKTALADGDDTFDLGDYC
jgi:hypothetical protein